MREGLSSEVAAGLWVTCLSTSVKAWVTAEGSGRLPLPPEEPGSFLGTKGDEGAPVNLRQGCSWRGGLGSL